MNVMSALLSLKDAVVVHLRIS